MQEISKDFRPTMRHTAFVWCRIAMIEAKASAYVLKNMRCAIMVFNDYLETILALSLYAKLENILALSYEILDFFSCPSSVLQRG